MALGETQIFCVSCDQPVLSVKAGMANTAHCPECGRRFTMKDYGKTPKRVAMWQAGVRDVAALEQRTPAPADSADGSDLEGLSMERLVLQTLGYLALLVLVFGGLAWLVFSA